MNMPQRRQIDVGGRFTSSSVEQKRAIEEVTKQSVGLASRVYQKAIETELKKKPTDDHKAKK
ncbi:MAG: hypothetical protein EOS54_04435 [Mesorhizobium sp.]|uniref:hypothetical protein n=1 Tax=unclassified Mesorhizobium TaxID=325217 RepID=UPI000F7505E8|nr:MULTISPECIES: hypothetical protein [unclassified Mesorhizobium]AZO47098.1 hypothetical protein EJ073_04110 [Mesorhizobium sp. M4B.F.Ca.ET.058.02.1.1]RWC57752.1 MAG: hypothetical protein EOS54_04435 [Mesorhizobium sp.]RWD13832.1 MAG: hypothetical protein EOS74_17690 [Mesorhizobium sp.]RWD55546.1 MAG: hypothetical protein EOS75_16415 [Mesorhizobium sp.]TIU68620.1 MAG: hypothetical protein E5W25_12225 [Mesorhizobium sp.]